MQNNKFNIKQAKLIRFFLVLLFFIFSIWLLFFQQGLMSWRFKDGAIYNPSDLNNALCIAVKKHKTKNIYSETVEKEFSICSALFGNKAFFESGYQLPLFKKIFVFSKNCDSTSKNIVAARVKSSCKECDVKYVYYSQLIDEDNKLLSNPNIISAYSGLGFVFFDNNVNQFSIVKPNKYSSTYEIESGFVTPLTANITPPNPVNFGIKTLTIKDIDANFKVIISELANQKSGYIAFFIDNKNVIGLRCIDFNVEGINDRDITSNLKSYNYCKNMITNSQLNIVKDPNSTNPIIFFKDI